MQLDLFGTDIQDRIQLSKCRRRFRRQAQGDGSITCRSERLQKRNRLLVARYYYYTEIVRRRHDDVERILSDCEFFLDGRQLANILIEYDGYFKELIAASPTRRQLSKQYPGFSWI